MHPENGVLHKQNLFQLLRKHKESFTHSRDTPQNQVLLEKEPLLQVQITDCPQDLGAGPP